jgi:conserved oligomeric Golgi complex subunit 3
MRLVGGGLLPKVVENMLDAKVELDGRLRTVINDFTTDFATRMTSTLPTKFIEKGTIADGGAISPVCRSIEKEVPILRKALDDYLEDTRTKETLVGAVQDRVIQIYEEFYESYASSLAKTKGIPVGAKGKGRQDAVWDVDTFEEWSEEVFRVGVAGLRSRDNDEEGSEEEEGADDI